MNSPFRAFLSLLVLGFIGTVIYFGAVRGLNLYNAMEKSSMKKQISVKPENIKGKPVLVDPWSIDEEEFTFFDTLDDPSMTKFIGLSENVTEPPNETNYKTSDFFSKVKTNFILQPDDVNAKKVLNAVTHKIGVQKQGESLASGFVLQVGSFKTLERANLLKNNLNKKGYPVSVVAAQISGKGEVYHRVVIGRFTEKEAADKVAIRVEQMENLESILKWQDGQNTRFPRN